MPFREQYYFISFLFFTPLGILLKAVTGRRMPGDLLPLLYGLLVLAAVGVLLVLGALSIRKIVRIDI